MSSNQVKFNLLSFAKKKLLLLELKVELQLSLMHFARIQELIQVKVVALTEKQLNAHSMLGDGIQMEPARKYHMQKTSLPRQRILRFLITQLQKLMDLFGPGTTFIKKNQHGKFLQQKALMGMMINGERFITMTTTSILSYKKQPRMMQIRLTFQKFMAPQVFLRLRQSQMESTKKQLLKH